MIVFAHIRDNFAAAFFPRWAEWVSAGVTALAGIVLRVNEDLMANAKTGAYDFMLSIAEQQTWATILILFAVARLTVLLINGAWRRSPYVRALMAFLACFLWTASVTSMSAVFGLAFAYATGFLVLDFGNMYRAARDARTVDEGLGNAGRGKSA